MTNRLSKETSPYLKQHANNPVDWYPWSDEALSRARAEDKPILLSVGYSACHWCHVMEHESFENNTTAQLMNDNFVNIKVDREERPDLDQLYQTVAQLLTRSGGWPLTVFLTPDLKPFFGGTYFPPEDKYGRPGFPRVLQALSEAYKNQRADVAQNAEKLTKAILQIETDQNGSKERIRPDKAYLHKVSEKLLENFDWRAGGFGSHPKFPNSMNLAFLWRYGLASDFGKALEAVVLSLEKMAKGGIFDQLGGGFHRYSVDENWSVPHFEKMLYDNGILLKLYSEVLLSAPEDFLSATQRELFIETIRKTADWAIAEMRSPEGLFYSALDADSRATDDEDSPSEEGTFYVWSIHELLQFLSSDERLAFTLRYGVSEHGNFEHKGQNILFQDYSLEEIGQKMELDIGSVRTLLEDVAVKTLQERNKRPRPALDGKCLLSWNSLMVSGLAWASVALNDDSLFRAADETVKAIKEKMTDADGNLSSVYAAGKAKIPGYLDDYTFFAAANLDLSRFSKIPKDTKAEDAAVHFIENARRATVYVEKHFSDSDAPGYFFTSDHHEKLLVRHKTHYDQAIPSGTAMMLQNLLALGEIGAETEFLSRAEDQIFSLAGHLEENPFGMGELSCAAYLYAVGPVCIAVGEGTDFSKTLFARSHLFQKPYDLPGAQVCYRQTCTKVNSGDEIPGNYLNPKLV